MTEQQIVSRALARDGYRPELAGKLFAEAAAGERRAGPLAAYALCRAKRGPDADCVRAVSPGSSASAASPPSRP